MNLIWLALKNLRHSARTYAAFFLSSTAAVWMFYLYGSLLFDPEVRQSLDRIQEGWEKTQALLVFIEVLVGLFSVFFIRYSQTAFIRARQSSLALLGLLGMEARRIRRTLVSESLIMGLGAILLGVGLGAVFSRLFYLVGALVLPLKAPGLPFSWQAALLALPVYTAIFAFTAWISAGQIVRRPVADVLREAVTPKAPPRLSLWRMALCVATLGTAYTAAVCGLSTRNEDWAFLVLPLLVPGLYLLFSQAGVAVLKLLRGLRGLYWRRTALITIAQMVAKVRDNAMVLFIAATLTTIAFTGLGWSYSGYWMADRKADAALTADLMVRSDADPERIESILSRHGVGVRDRFRIPVLKADTRLASADGVVYAERDLWVLSAAEFNRWRAFRGLEPITVPDGQAAHITPVPGQDTVGTHLQLGGPDVSLPTLRINGQAFGADFAAEAMLLSDKTFAKFAARFGSDAMDIWMFTDWRSLRSAQVEIWDEMRSGAWEQTYFLSKQQLHDSFRQDYALALFLTGFVGLLFILATGNMLYFKLFTDIETDRRQLLTLRKLGFREGEVRRIPTAQAAVMFGVPLVVAIIHGTFFIPVVDAKMGQILTLEPVAVVGGLFFLIYGIYFLITRRSYLNALLGPMD